MGDGAIKDVMGRHLDGVQVRGGLGTEGSGCARQKTKTDWTIAHTVCDYLVELVMSGLY